MIFLKVKNSYNKKLVTWLDLNLQVAHLTNQLFQSLYVLDLKQITMSLEPEFFINNKVEKFLANDTKGFEARK